MKFSIIIAISVRGRYYPSCNDLHSIHFTLRTNKPDLWFEPDIKFLTDFWHMVCKLHYILTRRIICIDQLFRCLLLMYRRATNALPFSLALIDKPACCQFSQNHQPAGNEVLLG